MARLSPGFNSAGTPADQILMTGPRAEHLAGLAAELKVRTSTDNRAAASEADVLVLCVKPQVMAGVCQALAGALKTDCLVISVAAGIRLASLGCSTAPSPAPCPTPQRRLAWGDWRVCQPADSRPEATAQQLLGATGLVQWVDDETSSTQ